MGLGWDTEGRAVVTASGERASSVRRVERGARCRAQKSLHSIIVDDRCSCLISTSEDSQFAVAWRLDVSTRIV